MERRRPTHDMSKNAQLIQGSFLVIAGFHLTNAQCMNSYYHDCVRQGELQYFLLCDMKKWHEVLGQRRASVMQ